MCRVAAVIRVCGQPAGVVIEDCCGAAIFATQLIELTRGRSPWTKGLEGLAHHGGAR